MANRYSDLSSVKGLAVNRGPGPGKCGDCLMRDVCPLEYDGNSTYSEEQAQKADYIAFQLVVLGGVLDAPPKDSAQTQPWTINPSRSVPKDELMVVRELYAVLKPIKDAEEAMPTGGLGQSIPAAMA